MNKNKVFYLISVCLLAIVFVLFSHAYSELNRYSVLNNRSNAVYSGFQNLARQINNAAVINPDLIRANDSSQEGNMFFADSSSVMGQLYSLKGIVKDSVNIRTVAKLDTQIRSELSWILQSNVPDSIIHHKATAHVMAVANINALIDSGLRRTQYLLQTHKKALTDSIYNVILWMITFIVLAATMLIYTTTNLLKQKTKTKVTKKALEQTEQQLRYTLDHMMEGVQIHDMEWRYTYVNDALVKSSTYSKEELIGHTLLERYPGIESTELFKTMQRCMDEKICERMDTEFVFPNGTKAHFELSIQSVPQGLFVLSVDRTEQHKAKEKLIKANRLYTFISAINQSIVYIRDEQELLDRACTVAAEIGLFKIAWIGLFDEDRRLNIKSVEGDVSAAGKVYKYSRLKYDSDALRNTVTGRVLRTGEYAMSNDVEHDPAMAEWREEHARYGIKSNISLPLKKEGKVIGIFGLNSTVAHFFDDTEIELLKEAAGDISFALSIFEKEELRKQADEQLHRSNEKLKDAQAIAMMGSWEVNMVNNIVHWSDEMYNILELPQDKTIPTNEIFLSMIHPEDAEFVNAAFAETFKTFREASNHFRIVSSSGTTKYVFAEWKFEFAYDRPIRIYGIIHDITASKKADERQALYTSIVNSSDDAIISKSLDGKITSWNYGAKKILGYSAEECIGHTVSMLIPTHLQNEEKSILTKIRKGEYIDHYETERVRKDGRIISVSLTISPIRDSRGNIIGASKIMRDITERKRAEHEINELNKKLQASNHQLSTIFNTLPANIALIDGKGEIIAVNKSWKQFADDNGLQGSRHCLGDNYIDTCEKVTGDDMETAHKMAMEMRQILQKNIDEFAIEYPCNSPTRKRWYRAEVRPLIDYNAPGAVVMHFNITERKEAEEVVLEMNNKLETRVQERTSELQEANNALEAFSYSVSHDLRAPVRAMIGFTSIIQTEYGQDFNPDLKDMFDHICSSSRRMNAIIDDMLTLAKYEKEKLRPERLNMTELVQGVWDDITFSSPHRAMLELPDLPEVTADSSMIQQVVVNLLSNAVKYSSKKEHPKIFMGYELKDTSITFYIRDNGAGFDMKNYDKLFGAFQRLHGSREFEGTGVGLLLVKKIIEKHGGHVWAEGKVDEGATFYFSLPVEV